MRTAFIFIAFLNMVFCFSQDLVSGFYEIDDASDGIPLKQENSDREVYYKTTGHSWFRGGSKCPFGNDRYK